MLAGALLLLLNCGLLLAMRMMTRGGRVHTEHQVGACLASAAALAWPCRQLTRALLHAFPMQAFWWLRRPKLVISTIKLLLFFLSFVISNAAYFAAFFGPECCFFSRTGVCVWCGALCCVAPAACCS